MVRENKREVYLLNDALHYALCDLRRDMMESKKEQHINTQEQQQHQNQDLIQTKNRLTALGKEYDLTKSNLQGEISSLQTLLVQAQSELGSLRGHTVQRDNLIVLAQQLLSKLTPWAGIEIPKEEHETRDQLGVEIIQLRKGGPADEAKLQIGDRILSVNNVETRYNSQFAHVIRLMQPGDSLAMLVETTDEDNNTVCNNVVVQITTKQEVAFEDINLLRRIASGVVLDNDNHNVRRLEKKLQKVKLRNSPKKIMLSPRAQQQQTPVNIIKQQRRNHNSSHRHMNTPSLSSPRLHEGHIEFQVKTYRPDTSSRKSNNSPSTKSDLLSLKDRREITCKKALQLAKDRQKNNNSMISSPRIGPMFMPLEATTEDLFLANNNHMRSDIKLLRHHEGILSLSERRNIAAKRAKRLATERENDNNDDNNNDNNNDNRKIDFSEEA